MFQSLRHQILNFLGHREGLYYTDIVVAKHVIRKGYKVSTEFIESVKRALEDLIYQKKVKKTVHQGVDLYYFTQNHLLSPEVNARNHLILYLLDNSGLAMSAEEIAVDRDGDPLIIERELTTLVEDSFAEKLADGRYRLLDVLIPAGH